MLQIIHTQDDLQDDAVQGEREEDQSDSICVCSSFKVGLKGKVSILLGFILLASFIFVLNLSTLNFMYSPSDHLGKLGRLIETLPSLERQYSCTIHTIYCHHNTVITKLGRHNKTGGLYNYSDPSIYDPTFDTVFNGPSINPCKLVILQIEVCQVTQQHCACYKSDHLNRSSGSARPSFPSSLCFGASWW